MVPRNAAEQQIISKGIYGSAFQNEGGRAPGIGVQHHRVYIEGYIQRIVIPHIDDPIILHAIASGRPSIKVTDGSPVSTQGLLVPG